MCRAVFWAVTDSFLGRRRSVSAGRSGCKGEGIACSCGVGALVSAILIAGETAGREKDEGLEK